MKKYIIFTAILYTLVACATNNNDVNPMNLTTEDLNVTIDENPIKGQVLGTVKASAIQGSVTFKIASQTVDNAMSIDIDSGELKVIIPSLFDFEARQKLEATIAISANGETQEVKATINLNDVTEPPRSIWQGANITFTKAAGADPTQEANQDRITDKVWITRDSGGGQIFNAKTETSANIDVSPAGTQWALGTLNDIDNLVFKPFRDAVGSPKEVAGKDLVLHLIEDNIYISVKFTSWSTQKTGGFAYERSTQ